MTDQQEKALKRAIKWIEKNYPGQDLVDPRCSAKGSEPNIGIAIELRDGSVFSFTVTPNGVWGTKQK